jgi:hypothetical protein
MLKAIVSRQWRYPTWAVFLCLCCTLPYWRALALPPISDDYLQIWLGRKYFHLFALPDLAADALYRCRATSIWLTGLTEYLFGSNQLVFNLQSMLLHAVNVGLIIALGRFAPFSFRLTVPAALLWGFNERHHEAVMWYASLPEQLVFSFVILSLLCWLSWWSNGKSTAYAATLVCFLLALLSKESAVVFCALLFLPLFHNPSGWRRAALAALPFFSLSALYFALNVAARDNHLHWNDGTFRFGWHFIPVVFNSTLRLFTLWGAAALIYLFFIRHQIDQRRLALSLLWVPVALAPYAFLAYQPRVPSRHVYLASLGVALILAMAFEHLAATHKRLAAAALLAYITFNTGYIWFNKHDQFLIRAGVTEQLVSNVRDYFARYGRHPIQVTCFPLTAQVGSLAIEEHTGFPAALVAVQQAASPSCGPTSILPILD